MSKLKRLSNEQLDSMPMDQGISYVNRYLDSHLPPYRRAGLLCYNIIFGAVCFYLAKNFKKFGPTFQKQKSSFGHIILKGTKISVTLTALYTAGFCLVSGITYFPTLLRDFSQMQGRVLGRPLIYTPSIQQSVLYEAMQNFGVSKEIQDLTKKQLLQKQQKLVQAGLLNQQIKEQIISFDPEKLIVKP